MIDPVTTRIWIYRAAFLGLCFMVLFLRLLPLGDGADPLPGPDLMLCLTFAWLVRRPEFVPALLIVAVFLLADFLFMRPPALKTIVVLIAAEFLRGQVHRIRDTAFTFEFMLVAATILAVVTGERLLHALTFTGQPPLGGAVLAALFTILAYPAVVLFSNVLFGVKKVTLGEAELLGHRL